MSYFRRQGLSGVGDVVSTATTAAGIAASALTNPYLSEILCRIKQVEAANTKRPVPACPTTAAFHDTMGVSKFMPALRAYAYAEQHPWAYPVMAALVVGVPFLLGYVAGRNR